MEMPFGGVKYIIFDLDLFCIPEIECLKPVTPEYKFTF